MFGMGIFTPGYVIGLGVNICLTSIVYLTKYSIFGHTH